MSTTLPIPERCLDDFVCPRLPQRQNLVDQHLQLSFGSNLEREPEIVGRIDRVSEDRNHVEIEIFHIERNVSAAVTSRGDEPALKAKRRERFRKRDGIADIVQHDIDPEPAGDAPRLSCQVLTPVVDPSSAPNSRAALTRSRCRPPR